MNQKYDSTRQSEKDRHSQRMGWICRILAILIIIVILGCVILGYFVSYTGRDGEDRDGLGRILDEVPGGLSLILSQWAGYIWFIIDCIVLFALIVLVDRLFGKSKTYFTGIRRVDF